MKPIDIIAPIFGLFWGLLIYIVLKLNKSKPKLWPRILGFGVGMYAFLSLMTASILREPISEFLDYAITNLFLSIPFGLIGYLAGREYARRKGNKK
jgi:hypothetical protein